MKSRKYTTASAIAKLERNSCQVFTCKVLDGKLYLKADGNYVNCTRCSPKGIEEYPIPIYAQWIKEEF